jgi:hypothetical protein
MKIPLRLPDSRRLNLLPLIGVVFFVVCGGAYGLEPVVAAVGGGWAIALIVLVPLVWSLPIALMVAELPALLDMRESSIPAAPAESRRQPGLAAPQSSAYSLFCLPQTTGALTM